MEKNIIEKLSLDAEPTLRNLFGYLYEDWVTAGHAWTKPGFHAVVIYRFGRWANRQLAAFRIPLMVVYRLAYWSVRNFYGIELFHTTNVGRRFHIAHQSAIVIHPFATIGDDCIVRQGVTVGTAMNRYIDEVPTLGNRVDVGLGAAIIGRVRVGDDVRIGPNVVVMTDIPAGATVVAQAARIIPAPKSKRVPIDQAAA